MVEIDEKLIETLERDLEKYDKVLLFMGSGKEHRDFLETFHMAGILKDDKKILLLSIEGVEEDKGYSCRRISMEEAVQLRRLYLTYEFSDRFEIFCLKGPFGSIMNYIETGILTYQGLYEALLH